MNASHGAAGGRDRPRPRRSESAVADGRRSAICLSASPAASGLAEERDEPALGTVATAQDDAPHPPEARRDGAEAADAGRPSGRRPAPRERPRRGAVQAAPDRPNVVGARAACNQPAAARCARRGNRLPVGRLVGPGVCRRRPQVTAGRGRQVDVAVRVVGTARARQHLAVGTSRWTLVVGRVARQLDAVRAVGGHRPDLHGPPRPIERLIRSRCTSRDARESGASAREKLSHRRPRLTDGWLIARPGPTDVRSSWTQDVAERRWTVALVPRAPVQAPGCSNIRASADPTRSRTTSAERCTWARMKAAAASASRARTHATISRCSAIVAPMRSSVVKS